MFEDHEVCGQESDNRWVYGASCPSRGVLALQDCMIFISEIKPAPRLERDSGEVGNWRMERRVVLSVYGETAKRDGHKGTWRRRAHRHSVSGIHHVTTRH